jgi:hypothetical protein
MGGRWCGLRYPEHLDYFASGPFVGEQTVAAAASVEQSGPHRDAHGVGSIARAHLTKCVAQVQTYGDVGDAETIGDRLVPHPTCEQSYHLNLSGCEVEVRPALTMLAVREWRPG